MKKLFTLLFLFTGLSTGTFLTPGASAQPLCQAGFQYSIGNSNPNGTMVSFYDSSFAAGNIVGWSWSFGNGLGSSLQNPVTQLMTGSYYVCLTITAVFQNQTCTSTYCDSLFIPGNVLCNPSFTFSVNQQTVQFNSASGAGNTSWYWDFGDGSNSNLANPSHTYSAPGTYSVILVVTNSNGITCTGVQNVVIQGSSSCNASFTWAPDSSGAIHFTNTSTGNFSSYSWNFGNGQTSTQQNPVYTYNSPGTYVVCLSIYNNSQTCFSTYCDTIVVQGGSGCSANFGYQVAPAGVFFNAVMQNNVSWLWDFGDGTTGTGANITHVFAPGTYTVCLTVATSNGITCNSCQVVTIQNNAGCSSNFALYPDTIIAHNYFLVNLATGAPPISFVWSWGDGTSSTGPYPSHTYASGGLYTICCTITDGNGCTSNTCYPFQLLRLAGGNPVTVNVIAGSTGIENPGALAGSSLYPNPASGNFIAGFSLNESADVAFSLINVTGQSVKNFAKQNYAPGNHTVTLDVSELASGFYILQIEANNQKIYNRIILE